MLLRGILSAAALAVAAAASAGAALERPAGSAARSAGDTLALAPMSLGNRAAAATLRTRREDRPLDREPGPHAPIPSFRYDLRVGPGDTLAGLLTGAGVSNADTQGAIRALSGHFNPKRLRQGQRIAVIFQPPAPGTPDARSPSLGRFLGIVVEPDYDIAIRVEKGPRGGFSATKAEKALNRDLARAEGVIESSLYLAGRKAGIPNRVLAELIRAYSWDVDFQRDIRSGDRFEVLYERVFDAAGKQVFSGPIAFAALTLSGKRHAIYLPATAGGTRDYFDAKGRSVRKALMRTPIDGARLSSGFGRRRHPILGYTKLHRGVDFAAPRGTPIYAAGNGTIVRAGRNGAYGKYVRIRHNSRYSTAYAHMSGFARGVRRNKRVTQGQVIGYVGTTGRSTGPHLHYEILAGGVRTNPMKLRMPSGKKLKGAELARFQETRAGTEEKYAALKPIEVADAGK